MERLNPILKQTIEREEYRKIGGLIFETMASIATAVGREIFQNDSSSLLEIIFQVKGMIEEDDDPRIESINNSLVKLVQVMKDQFAPYFGRLLPDLLLNVQLNPRLEYLNCFSFSFLLFLFFLLFLLLFYNYYYFYCFIYIYLKILFYNYYLLFLFFVYIYLKILFYFIFLMFYFLIIL